VFSGPQATEFMRISFVLTTYERPDALRIVLSSLARQSRPPDELLVADDGSGPATADVVKNAALPFPVKHLWLAHDGFRAGRMRNLGLANASGDYVIFADDDILLHPDFVLDHCRAAKPAQFIQGTRALLDQDLTDKALAGKVVWPSLFESGVKNRKNLVRSSLLSGLMSGLKNNLRGIRTCNFSLWREDAVKVNGFYEGFVGWGREDSEFAARLLNSGIKRYNLKFAALGCHLEHPPRARDRFEANDAILQETLDRKLTWRDTGLDSHSSQ
jgi:Glycosyltransferases involved in cell wall biogenesis